MNFQLKYPIAIDGHDVVALKLRRAKVKDIEAIQAAVTANGEVAASITSISRLCDISEDAVREIDGEDFVRLAEAITAFLPQATSSTSSAA